MELPLPRFRVYTTIKVEAAVAAAPTEAVKLKCEEGRYVVVWLPREKEKPVPAPTADDEGMLRFGNCVSVAEQRHSE